LALIGESSLFEQTLERCQDDKLFNDIVVVTGARLLEHVQGQLATASAVRILVEPEPRNTAASIALAALGLPADEVMLVCPSDHHIGDVKAFKEAVSDALELAREGWLVCIGIKPTRPEEGFGYLKRGASVLSGFRVDRFVEKPDRARASEFLRSGEYFWNAGIFAFRAGRFLEELGKHRPAMLEAVGTAFGSGREERGSFHPEAAAFGTVVGESVDYAVMENADRVAMIPADLSWSDIGNWRAVREARPSDEQGNSGRGPVEIIDCRNVLAESDGPRVHVLGVEDLIVIVDGNDVLVTRGDAAAAVGKLPGALDQ
jgi:mannose-1-phosphate guanylyltransferase/mannose-1-phosphate guanylyltransferase/mannose-6-phosphate isomerase